MDLDYLVIVLPAVIERINQIAKRVGLPGRYAPALGAGIGVVVCVVFAFQQNMDPLLWGLIGVLAGGSSGPLHDVLDRLPKRRRQHA